MGYKVEVDSLKRILLFVQPGSRVAAKLRAQAKRLGGEVSLATSLEQATSFLAQGGFRLLLWEARHASALHPLEQDNTPKLILAYSKLIELAKALPRAQALSPRAQGAELDFALQTLLQQDDPALDLVQRLRQGFFLADPATGKFLWGNPAFWRILEVNEQATDLPFANPDEVATLLTRAAQEPTQQMLLIRQADGKLKWLLMEASPHLKGQVQGSLQDATGHKEAEDLSELQRELMDHLSIKLEISWIAPTLASYLLQSFPLERVCLVNFADPGYTPGGQNLQQAQVFQWEHQEVMGIKTKHLAARPLGIRPSHGLFALMAEVQDPMRGEDVAKALKQRGEKQNPMGKKTHCFPILLQNRLLAILGLTCTAERDLSEREWHFFHNLSHQLGPVLENANMVSGLEARIAHRTLELESLNQEMQQLTQVAKAVNASLELHEVMLVLVKAYGQIFSFDLLQLYHYEEGHLHLYRSFGAKGEEFPAVASLAGNVEEGASELVRALLAKEPVFHHDLSPLAKESALLHHWPQATCLYLPMLLRDQPLGLIAFFGLMNPFAINPETLAKVVRLTDQVATAIQNARLYEDLKQAKVKLAETERVSHLLAAFERFVPKQFIQRLAPEGVEFVEIGQAHADFITLMFSDIRAFTTLAENMSPKELFEFLNHYLQRMNGPIREHNGFVDKFIGDAIMAVFDNQGDGEHQEARDALRAATGMQEALQAWNREREEAGLFTLQIGVGIHSGHVIIGTVGVQERMDATLIGDAVNIASRLEGLTKAYGVGILASHDTVAMIQNRREFQFRVIDWVRVEGRRDPIRIFEVFNHDPEPIIQAKLATNEWIKKGLSARRKQNWGEARECFAEGLKLLPQDPALMALTHKLAELEGMDLPPGWDGAVKMLKPT